MLEINWNPSRRELRQFAVAWICFFGLLALYFWLWKGTPKTSGVLACVAAIGLIGVIIPALMRAIYIVWMFAAMPIGWVISHLFLAIVYYLVFTPIGLVMRLCGYDPLARRIDRSAKSYWTPHEPGAGAERYFKQF